jgi:hypothetical protein
MLRYAAAVAMAGLFAAPALAADEEGRFAMRGVGIVSCGQYLELIEDQPDQLPRFFGWLNGYLSAANQYEEDTYNLVPWQETRLLAAALARYCQQFPDRRFGRAVIQMAEQLRARRLETSSELLTIPREGGESLRIYRAALERVEAALNDAGYDAGPPDGEYDVATEEALTAYQQDRGLPVTGLPDQQTLGQLFYAGDGAGSGVGEGAEEESVQ